MATTFNDDFKRLDEIVSKLESNELGLDEAILLYQEGMKLSKKLEKDLSKVATKLESDEHE